MFRFYIVSATCNFEEGVVLHFSNIYTDLHINRKSDELKKRMFNKVGMKVTPLDIRRDRWKHVSGETRDFKVKYNDELLERNKSCAKK